MQPKTQEQQPFFAQFLEKQAAEQAVKAQQDSKPEAASKTTLKFPSDNDDHGGDW